jgi:hypothetical protein
MILPLTKINLLKQQLESHPLLVGGLIKDVTDLHIFMEHHVFAVWDFMCLLKSLQHQVCPSTNCWVPTRTIRSGAARLINEIVLGEESDLDIDGVHSITHHDLYCQAMLEVGADANTIEKWVDFVRAQGVYSAIEEISIPTASLKFVKKTFQFIDSGEAHIIAAAFCFGRETIIPQMFQKLLANLNLSKIECPKFHYYLERHIQVDAEEHGPASISLVENLCDHDPVHIHEAEQAAIEALRARIELWDAVADILQNHRSEYMHN